MFKHHLPIYLLNLMLENFIWKLETFKVKCVNIEDTSRELLRQSRDYILR